MDVTSHSGTNWGSKPAKGASNKYRKNSYTLEVIVQLEENPTGNYYTVRWCGYIPSTIRSNPPGTSSTNSGSQTGENYKNTGTPLPGGSKGQSGKEASLKRRLKPNHTTEKCQPYDPPIVSQSVTPVKNERGRATPELSMTIPDNRNLQTDEVRNSKHAQ